MKTFVTDDGFETDLDLGHYERYIDENLTRKSSVTTGQIYLSVIEKERRGDYLGKTVQVIPHVVNEIKERIEKLSKDSDVTVIEIGGTVWDIEWPHFIESMRELRQEYGKDNIIFVHVAPIIQISTSWELKSKAIQHSIIKLREMWIQADILVCRSQQNIDQNMKKKLAMFCDIPLWYSRRTYHRSNRPKHLSSTKFFPKTKPRPYFTQKIIPNKPKNQSFQAKRTRPQAYAPREGNKYCISWEIYRTRWLLPKCSGSAKTRLSIMNKKTEKKNL